MRGQVKVTFSHFSYHPSLSSFAAVCFPQIKVSLSTAGESQCIRPPELSLSHPLSPFFSPYLSRYMDTGKNISISFLFKSIQSIWLVSTGRERRDLRRVFSHSYFPSAFHHLFFNTREMKGAFVEPSKSSVWRETMLLSPMYAS